MIRQILLLGILLRASLANGEEELVKNGGTYLGRQTSPAVFTTCAGGQITIGDGKLSPTVRRCQKPVIAGPFAIRSIDSSRSRVIVEDDNRTQIELDLPDDVDMVQLAIGTRVTIGGDDRDSRTITTER